MDTVFFEVENEDGTVEVEAVEVVEVEADSFEEFEAFLDSLT